jgi:excisionase family DNA binding protein
MESTGGLLVVGDAAAQLGVNHQRVRALLAQGDLRGRRVGGIWLIDPQSLADYLHVRQPRAGRALAPTTAWAALLTAFATALDDDVVAAFEIVDKRRDRIRALADRDVDDWRWLARRRAVVDRYTARTAYLDRLRDEADIMPAGLNAERGRSIVAGSDMFDAYVDAQTSRRLVERYRLRPDTAGNVTLRRIDLDAPDQIAVIQGRPLPDLVVAVDLCEDRDPRTASAGRHLLSALVDVPRAARR